MSDEEERARAFAREMGRLIAEARNKTGMSQAAVERAAGLMGGTFPAIERGDALDLPVYTLVCIAEAMSVDLALLVPASASGEPSAG